MQSLRSSSVEIVIPHWNQAESLRRALESLRHQTQLAAVCVVDNGSTDSTSEVLAEFPEARVVELGANRGFAAAVNAGALSSRADFIILMNNDCVADERFVEELVCAWTESEVAMVAGCLRAPDGSIESLGVVADQSLVAYDYHHGKSFDFLPGGPLAVLAPTGGAGGFERTTLCEVGGFDERIFAYLEDVDLGIRMRMIGAQCVVARRAFCWHEHSASLGQRSAAKNERLGWSAAYLGWKFREAMTPGLRARRLLIDALVMAGKAAVDRDLGMVRGWLSAKRDLRGHAPERLQGELARVPREHLGMGEALARRLARRRGTGRHS